MIIIIIIINMLLDSTVIPKVLVSIFNREGLKTFLFHFEPVIARYVLSFNDYLLPRLDCVCSLITTMNYNIF